ncbi:MAG TPA: hypothetical protein VIL00_01850 [Pseudonocardiaceae bacterium]
MTPGMRVSGRRMRLAAALGGAALLAGSWLVAPAAASPISFSDAIAEPHLECGTSVEGRYASGWCRGTGTFRLRVECENQGERVSGRSVLFNSYAMVTLGCKTRVLDARIEILE